MKRSDLRGTGQVLRFTLVQYLKSKSTVSMLIVMFLLSAVCMFTLGMSAQSAENISPEDTAVESLSVCNFTSLDIRTEDIAALLPETSVILNNALSDASAAADIEISDDGSYTIDLRCPAGAYPTVYTALQNALRLAHYRASGITEQQLSAALTPITVNTDYIGNILEGEGGFEFNEAHFALSYGYSIIVMMLTLFSASYIIRSVAEEKDSKLVELLMVSIKPLSLILGKILATMVFVLISLGTLLVGFGVTAGAMSLLLDTSDILASADLSAALGSIGISAASGADMIIGILLLIPVFLVSILLGYLTFSLIAGISGACCSTINDINSASGAVSIISIVCYMIALFVPMMPNAAITVFSLLPFISVFCAPVSFVTGAVGFGTVALSWLLQSAVIVLLALFCSRVYGALIIYRGNRVKLGALLSLARKKGGKA